jgi:hypothetical protein
MLRFASLASEFIGALLVAQQRAVNTRTSSVAQSRFKVSAFQQLRNNMNNLSQYSNNGNYYDSSGL